MLWIYSNWTWTTRCICSISICVTICWIPIVTHICIWKISWYINILSIPPICWVCVAEFDPFGILCPLISYLYWTFGNWPVTVKLANGVYNPVSTTAFAAFASLAIHFPHYHFDPKIKVDHVGCLNLLVLEELMVL